MERHLLLSDLEDYLCGHVDEAEASSLEEHLLICEVCCELASAIDLELSELRAALRLSIHDPLSPSASEERTLEVPIKALVSR